MSNLPRILRELLGEDATQEDLEMAIDDFIRIIKAYKKSLQKYPKNKRYLDFIKSYQSQLEWYQDKLNQLNDY